MKARILKQGYWVIAIAVVLFLCVSVVEGSNVTTTPILTQAQQKVSTSLATPILTQAQQYVSASLTTPIPTQAPTADFILTPTSGQAPFTVAFIDTSSGSPTTWAWDFNNDGTIDSTARNAMHTYTAAGTYTVKLTVTNSGGSGSMTKENCITVSTQVPLIEVSTSQTTIIPMTTAPPTEVSTSLSTPTPTQLPPVLIESNPPGAQVWVDSVLRGLTPVSVVLEPGPHKLFLQKTGYQDYNVSIYYPSPTALGTFILKPLTTITMSGTPEPVPHTNLSIDSTPTGAQIWVDSVDKGITPISMNVTRGVHSILLKKTGYDDYNTSVNCQENSVSWTYPLVKIPEAPRGTLTDIWIRSIPPVAQVLVDSRNFGYTPTNVSIEPGQHNIQLQKTGFKNYAGIFTFAPGQSWTFVLDPENSTASSARTGGVDSIVEIYSVPSGAQVLMDQWDCGSTPVNIVTSIGPHSILLRKAGFEDYIENVSIYRDIVVSYSLEPVVTPTTPTTMPTPTTTKASFPVTASLVALGFVGWLFMIGRFQRGA